MAELTFKIHTSVDGFVGRIDGGLDWLDRGFEDEELEAWELAMLWRTDLHLMGRSLYDDMASYWPTSDEPFAAPMNQIPKAVVSSTLESAPWARDNVIASDLTSSVERLKSESRDGVLLHGGATTGREMARRRLIDRWVLVQHPVVLGDGLPIFSEEQCLRLEESTHFPTSGVVARSYRPM